MPLLLSVLDHYLGITQNRTNGRLKLLANVGEKHSVESVVFVAQRRRLHNRPQFSRKDNRGLSLVPPSLWSSRAVARRRKRMKPPRSLCSSTLPHQPYYTTAALCITAKLACHGRAVRSAEPT